MTAPIHIPILRLGQRYDSIDRVTVTPLGSDQPIAEVSQALAGMIRRDAKRFDDARATLDQFTTSELLAMCHAAGDLFMNADLPLGDAAQSPADYIDQLSGTSGLPHTLVRANMAKIHEVFTEMPTILRGLTRGLDLSILDAGFGEQVGVPVSYYPTTSALGVVLPSNSPGVNSLWMPAIAMKIPVVLKPGREEPWTPWRIIAAFIGAGVPTEAFGFYPTDHEGAGAVMDVCGRSIIFGGEDTVRQYSGDERVEVHGPGWSKLLIGDDCVEQWRDHLDVIVKSIAGNSGRSCINASAVLTPRDGRSIAEGIAERLATIEPAKCDDPAAALSAFANPKMAQWIDQQITQGLKTPGAIDLTAARRGRPERLVEIEGITYLLPTLIYCESWNHPLADREFMFPFASVVEMPQSEMVAKMGSSLVVTAITNDAKLTRQLLGSRDIQRLNLGPVPTSVAKWDQPHEGNLFEFLYHRRAIQRAAAGV
jgi:hypothetical protein